MKPFLPFLLAVPLFAGVTLSGCSSMDIEKFSGSTPEFALEEFFDGKTEGWGMIHTRSGKLSRLFQIRSEGTYEDGILRFTEYYDYDDGQKEARTWTVKKLPNGRYTGKANDSIGEASGESKGKAFHWQYALEAKEGLRPVDVSLNDWFYLQPDGTLMAQGDVTKWGFEIANVVIVFRKTE